MKSARRWLLWKTPVGGSAKIPCYVNGVQRHGNLDEDAHMLVSYDEAKKACVPPYKGLGFALGPDGNGGVWQGIDLDSKLDSQVMEDLLPQLPGYVEVSPSGNGYHCIGYGEAFKTLGSNGVGIEAYCHARYFTVTESIVRNDPLVCLKETVETLLAPIHSRPKTFEGVSEMTPEEQIRVREALCFIPSDDRDLWVKVAFDLRAYENVGRGLWLTWSASSPKYDPADASRVWESCKEKSPNIDAVFKIAKGYGWVDSMPLRPDDFDMISDMSIEDLSPVEFVIDGFIEAGAVTISGAAGAGKTTQIVPLAAKSAWLCAEDDWLKPELRRKVVYISEDVGQVLQCLFALKAHGGVSAIEINTWFHVLPAKRMPVKKLQQFIKKLREDFGYFHEDGFWVNPLIVLDTTNSVMEVENINDNGEVSTLISSVRQAAGLKMPIWFVRHVAKSASKSKDAQGLTSIGAYAWTSDVQQCIALTTVGYGRKFTLTKWRFQPKFQTLISSGTLHWHQVKTPWGSVQDVGIYHCVFHFNDLDDEDGDEIKLSPQQQEALKVLPFPISFNDAVMMIHKTHRIYVKKQMAQVSLRTLVDRGILHADSEDILHLTLEDEELTLEDEEEE